MSPEPTQIAAAASPSPEPTWGEVLGSWARRRPSEVALLGLLVGALIYFFGFYRVFMNGVQSTMVWASLAWNSENDLEYGWAIIPVAIGIAWYHRSELLRAPKSTSWVGLFIAFLGAALFLLGVRAL